jgi:hypothetical protein
MTWNVISAFVLDQIFGYQSANKIRQNLVALSARRAGRFLGGSRIFPNLMADTLVGGLKSKVIGGLGPFDVFGYIDVEIDGTEQTGQTFQAFVEVRTNNPAVSITPKIRNVTDSSDAGVGAACTATAVDYSGTNQKQTIALTIPTGVKKYRLQFTLGANAQVCETWATGEIVAFTTS